MADTDIGPSASTRRRVLELLRVNPRTVQQLVGVLGLTANGVRVHLTTLERDGLIRRAGVRHGSGVGKPPLVYAATAAAESVLSTAYVPVLTALANTIATRMPAREMRATFEAAGRRLGAAAAPQYTGDPVDAASSLLKALGAAVTVDRDGTTGRAVVMGAACPLGVTVRECPESCEMVRAMIARATGVRVVTRCVHGDAPRCRFEMVPATDA